jgi:hypothetical protein
MTVLCSDGSINIEKSMADMKHRIAGMAICFVILFAIITPICNAFEGTAIVAYRSNVLPTEKDVGHVGVGYQNIDGTWTCGAIEGHGGFQPNILYPDIGL